MNPTDNITDVANTINGLWLGYGADWPEDYTRALYEVISVGWRPHTKKIVVLFGDAPTHDLDFAGYNFGGDPGRDAVAQTDDDLEFETVVQQVADEGVSVIAVDSGYTAESEATFRGMSSGFDKRAEKAVTWALDKRGSTDYAYKCLRFVWDAYELTGADIHPLHYDYAKQAADALNAEDNPGIPPWGAYVFYNTSGTLHGEYRNWGHVGLSLGGGDVVHAADKVRVDNYLDISPAPEWTDPEYIGWAWPPLEAPMFSLPHDAIGTNGRYFNLDDASQVPTATVQLIISETQQIDHLSLQVTEGYEDWVQVTPPEYTNVGSNITKTFNITITVPGETSSGFYPFLIQAIGDGAILGLTHVDVTVPSPSPVDDIGFRPNRDGFRFDNDSSTQTWEMFKQFFGDQQVEHSNGNRIHVADVFYQPHYRNAGNGGSCDGFSATSLINYENLTQPNAGDFAMPHHSPLYSKNRDDDIWEAIAFAQGIQMGLEKQSYRQTMCRLLGNSPRAFYQHLKSQIQNNSPVVLGIRWDKDYYAYFPREKVLEAGGGHTLVPYRFEEPSSNEAYVYVYDSNLPGNDKHRVEFDLVNDKWTYRWPVPLWPDITIEGDAAKCLLDVTPIDIYRHQGIAFWAQAGWTTSGSSLAEATSAQVFATSGPARLLFTDDEERRLGWDGTDFYDEIPGASYIPVAKDETFEASGFYYISSDVLYNLKVYGYGEGQADVGVWSGGYLVQLSGLEVVTGTVTLISLRAFFGLQIGKYS